LIFVPVASKKICNKVQERSLRYGSVHDKLVKLGVLGFLFFFVIQVLGLFCYYQFLFLNLTNHC